MDKFMTDFFKSCAKDHGFEISDEEVEELLLDMLRKANGEKPVLPDHCPKCGSGLVNYDSLTVESGWVSQEANCPKCGHHWNDVYKLVEQEPIEEVVYVPSAHVDLHIKL